MKPSHYDTLGLHPACSENDIKLAYRKLAKEHHPDREGGDAERMAAINQAYEVLSDPERRAHYDATGLSDLKTVDDEARKALADLLNQVIAESNGRPIDTCRDVIKRTMDAQNSERITAQRRIRHLEKLSGKIRCKAGENLAQAVIENQLAQLQAQIKRMDRQIEIAAAGLTLLDDYEHEPEEADQPTGRGVPLFINTGTATGSWL
jgi:curved DNA-binding protein CbpA